MNYDKTVFVYQRKDSITEIRADYIETARMLEDDKEWEHIATLEPRAYIKAILSEYPSLVRKLKGESV